jgi:hypothetical protein
MGIVGFALRFRHTFYFYCVTSAENAAASA